MVWPVSASNEAAGLSGGAVLSVTGPAQAETNPTNKMIVTTVRNMLNRVALSRCCRTDICLLRGFRSETEQPRYSGEQ